MSVTMPRPGSVVQTRTGPPPRTLPTNTGVWFASGMTDRGPADHPVLISSLQEFINTFGGRQTYSPLYDAIETFFREGGSQVYVSRVVGPGAATSFVNLADAGAVTSLVARAKGPGAYANTRRITVQVPGNGGTAGSFSLLITDTADPTVNEQSPDFVNQAAAIAWSQFSSTITLTLGTSANNPIATINSPMATGADDRAGITDTQWKQALDRIPKDLGPGQVSQVGRSTTQAYIDTLAHAQANNRVAILDLPDSPTVATLTAAAAGQRGGNDIYGAAFGPWLVIPGLTPNTTRIVPPSAGVAAKCAASDGAGNSPNVPAAGFPLGVFSYVIGLSQPAYDNGTGVDGTRDAMYALGVNLIVFRYGLYEVFGWRTLTDPNGANQDWINLGNRRLAMAMIAEGNAILEPFILSEIDGQGRTFGKLKGLLQGMCGRYYALGSLYGDKPEDSYAIDTGPSVNTPATIQNREIHAAMAVRMTQDGELVVLELAKIPVSQTLPTAA